MLLTTITAAGMLAGCGQSSETIHMATKPMTEQYIMGSMMKTLIEQDTDLTVEVTEGVGGGTANIQPAMEEGEFDFYPEYTGSGWNEVLKEESIYDESMFDQLQEGYDALDMTWTGMLGFNNTYGLVVASDIAQQYDLKTYSDLATVSDQLVFGAEYDFFEREDGYDALCDTYGLTFKDTMDLDIGLKYDALAQKEIDVMNIFTTDGQLSAADAVVLEDDKGLYPSYMCGFVVRNEVLEEHPELQQVFDKVENLITDAEMAKMNYQVETEGQEPEDVATAFLQKDCWISDRRKGGGVRRKMWRMFQENAGKNTFLAAGKERQDMSVVEYRQVRMAYGEKVIIDNFNLSIEKGEFVTIIGSSGCGKTTILKMVNGLVQPVGGEVLVEGRNTREVDLAMLRRNIGYAIQGSVLFPHMTVEKNIAYVPNLLNRKDKKRTAQAVAKWMGIVGLDDSLRSRYPSELSGGQQQRVGIARALAASPDILLMDEPFGAVDEITRGSLQDEIARIHRETGITILFVTHDIGEALKLGTKVLVMDQGSVQQFAPPREILHDPATDYVKKLVEKERRRCHLPEEKLGDCAYSGVI